MKVLLLLMTLSGVALAQPTGFSPTMPFGISCHRTQAAVNSGSCSHLTSTSNLHNSYNYYSNYYYYGGGANRGLATDAKRSASFDDTLPSYKSPSQKQLDSYNKSNKRNSDTLPGY